MRIFMAVGSAVAKGMTPYGQYVLQDIFATTPHPHLYGTFQGIGYPPLWGLITGEMYRISSFLAPNNLYAYVLALKIPVILGELALAVLVYNILKVQRNERIATATFLLFIFSPFVISVGTMWGMFDVIAIVFALLSAYILMHNWKFSSIFLGLSSTLKVFPVILAPLYSILLYKSNKRVKPAVGFLLSTVGLTALLTFLPMIAFGWPLSNMYNALTYHIAATTPSYYGTASFPYGAASPFNAFAVLTNLSGGDVQPPWVSIYFWIPACIAVYALLLRARTTVVVKELGVNTEFALTTQWSLLLLLTMFTTRVWVSEQNLIFLFTFFSMSVFLQYSQELDKVELLWLLLFIFVLVHVPVISFFWLPLPWTLVAATSFADGPLGWTRLLLMTVLTFGWLILCWRYVVNKLRWW
jgi:Gpi18-like mannosyltransferase